MLEGDSRAIKKVKLEEMTSNKRVWGQFLA